MTQVLRKLGLVPKGRNYKSIQNHIKRLGLSTTHFRSTAWNKGKKRKPRKPISEFLKKDTLVQSSKLRVKPIESGLKENKCEICGLIEWCGNPIVLHLDHINGDNRDNRIHNLRLLCPNCHSQTSTYCGRNARKPTPCCKICKVEKVSVRGGLCRSCAQKSRPERFKIEWPDIITLKNRVTQTSYSAVARELGVSDNAVRKHIKRGEKENATDS